MKTGDERRSLALRDKIGIATLVLSIIVWIFMFGAIYQSGENHMDDVDIHLKLDVLDVRYMPRETLDLRLNTINETLKRIEKKIDEK